MRFILHQAEFPCTFFCPPFLGDTFADLANMGSLVDTFPLRYIFMFIPTPEYLIHSKRVCGVYILICEFLNF